MFKFNQVEQVKPDPLVDLVTQGIEEEWERCELHQRIKAAGLDEVSDDTLDHLVGCYAEMLEQASQDHKRSKTKLGKLLGGAVTAVPNPAFATGGDLMTYEEWAEAVACCGFIDYDGYGIWSDGVFVIGEDRRHPEVLDYLHYGQPEPIHHGPTQHDQGVWPSLLTRGMLCRPSWATHVLWFNR